jgi:hypothetical protein
MNAKTVILLASRAIILHKIHAKHAHHHLNCTFLLATQNAPLATPITLITKHVSNAPKIAPPA